MDIDILAEREQDIKMARLLSLQAHVAAEEAQHCARDDIGDKDIFARYGARQDGINNNNKII